MSAVGLVATGIVIALASVWLLAGCATVVPGHTIVLKNGTTYPCPHGVQLDSHYRCIGEDSPAWAPSYVRRIDP